MNFAGLIFMVAAHYFSGKGVLKLFNLQLPPLFVACLSVIIGIPLLSFAPCALQLLHIPITIMSVFVSISIFTVIFSIPLFIKFKRPQFIKIGLPHAADWPFYFVVAYFMVMSVWRCYYLPPFSRDMMSGPELLAKYAVQEKTMISSVFNIDLSTTNNFFKSPYITCLQIIYKLLVTTFGQLWLSVLFVPFTIWMYSLVRKLLHPLLAGLLMVFFITVPELYAYTYLILYDYSNMVFFFSGFYFLTRYLDTKQLNQFAFSAFLFGLATYIRTETLILLSLMSPLLIFHFYRNKLKLVTAACYFGLFFIVPAAFYYLNIDVFVKHFIPIPFDLKGNINPNLSDVSPFFQRLSDINTRLIFSDQAIGIFGYYFLFFLIVLAADLVFLRRFNRDSLLALYGVAVVYFGLALVGYLLPLADLMNTTKRGLFKAIPLTLWYMSNSGVMLYLSAWIKKMENPEPKSAGRPVNKVATPVTDKTKQKAKISATPAKKKT